MQHASQSWRGKVPALLLALLAGALVPAHAQGCTQTGQLCTGPPLSNTEGNGMGVCSCPAVVSGNACDCLQCSNTSKLYPECPSGYNCVMGKEFNVCVQA